MNLPVIKINESDRAGMKSLLQKLQKQSFNFNSCNIDLSLFKTIRNEINNTHFPYLLEASEVLRLSNKGYLIIDFGKDFDFYSNLKATLAIVLCSIVYPFGIFEKFGLWKEIGVDLTKEPNRSSGVGYNPFHIDFVNTTNPPFYSILFCIRQDPNGGGQTIVSNFLKVIEELSKEELVRLEKSIYSEGSFFGLQNVGIEYNPFPILQINSVSETILRFTSKINSEQNLDISLVNKIEKLLIKNQDTFLLEKNQLVIFNQRIVCHGRLALNGQQSLVNQNDRRLLLQTFGRNYAD
ncbi:MAG: TauD/TfdA family dioxygenase [Ignavibacteriaceae bacterium]|jgi:hypothetical protein